MKKIYRITFLFKPGHFIIDEMSIECELDSENVLKDAYSVLYSRYGEVIDSILNVEEVL